VKALVVATGNRGKLAEIAAILDGLGIALKTPADFPGAPVPVEDGATYRDNALIKARALCAFTGLPAIGDDTGLEVDALGGAPGLISARYAGPAQDAARNREKLLAALEGVPPGRRAARFVCSIALALPDGRALAFDGECRGAITAEPRGAAGFGYDPVFLVPELGRTMAELDPADKNRLSHRGRALEKLRAALRDLS
jgi:XTP/dITP diphosphohydrolase